MLGQRDDADADREEHDAHEARVGELASGHPQDADPFDEDEDEAEEQRRRKEAHSAGEQRRQCLGRDCDGEVGGTPDEPKSDERHPDLQRCPGALY